MAPQKDCRWGRVKQIRWKLGWRRKTCRKIPPVYSSKVFTYEHMESQWQERSNTGLSFDKLVTCRGFEGVWWTLQHDGWGSYNSSWQSKDERSHEDLLQTYNLILYRLETVDLRRMSNKEKIPFWVNIHNALLMHMRLKRSESWRDDRFW